MAGADLAADPGPPPSASISASSSSADRAKARGALLAAVEGGADGSDGVRSAGPLVRLFFGPGGGRQRGNHGYVDDGNGDDGDGNDDDDDNDDDCHAASGTDSRPSQEELLAAVRSPRFDKRQARRLFAGVGEILAAAVEGEQYVPASAYENDNSDNGDNGDSGDHSDNGTNGVSAASFAEASHNTNVHKIVPDAASTEALLFMKACCLLVGAYLEGLVQRRTGEPSSSSRRGRREYAIIDEAFAVAELLHDSIFSLQSCGPIAVGVQSAVSAMCEGWWHSSFEGREQLVTMLVPLLVAKTLDEDAGRADVRRLFRMREALDLLDFADPSIDYLRSLLLRTVSSPHYLRTVEGRRLVAHIFQLDPELVRDVHLAIRAQIPDARRSLLDAYGDIYLRAWRDAHAAADAAPPGGDAAEAALAVRASIEESALQDLAVAALHAGDRGLSRSVRVVLAPLHGAKREPEIDRLLHRTYGPVLWRALSAANPAVRLNAAPVLADTFPLRDPDGTEDELGRAVARTVDALLALLRDPHPAVRVAASGGTGRLLLSFWDALPANDIRRLLNEIVTRHSSDATSAAVRAEAVATVGLLLDAEHARAVLRPLLPSMGNLIHDKSERVRLAVVHMLLKIKKIRGLKYYHVVPVEHLLSRLQAEGEVLDHPSGPVASALTGLMLNSYFPQGEGVRGSDQIKRTLKFLSNNPEAAAVFYTNITDHLSVSSVAKLAKMLLKCLSAAVQADVRASSGPAGAGGGGGGGMTKKRGRDDPSSVPGDDDDDQGVDRDGGANFDKTLDASNTRLMASIAKTICCLWESIGPSLSDPDNRECQAFLTGAFSGPALTDALSHFEAKAKVAAAGGDQVCRMECLQVEAAILRCAGNLSPAAVEGLASHITSVGADAGSNLPAQITLLFIWGREEDVARSIYRSIAAGLTGEQDSEIVGVPSSSQRRSSKRKARAESKATDDALPFPSMSAMAAVGALNTILRGSDPSCIAARDAILSSTSACGVLEKALDAATHTAEKMLNSDFDPKDSKISLVLAACEAYGKLAIHKVARKGGQPQLTAQLKTLLFWVTSRLTAADGTLNKSAASPLGDLNLSIISLDPSVSSPDPASPPPKQRSNRNDTPQKAMDASFDLDIDKASSSITVKNAPLAVYLIKSALLVFSEWIAVGGTGAREISANATRWLKILECESVDVDAREELIPAFCKLANHIARKGWGSSLAEAVAVISDAVDEGSSEEIIIKKMVVNVKKLADKENSNFSEIQIGVGGT